MGGFSPKVRFQSSNQKCSLEWTWTPEAEVAMSQDGATALQPAQQEWNSVKKKQQQQKKQLVNKTQWSIPYKKHTLPIKTNIDWK